MNINLNIVQPPHVVFLLSGESFPALFFDCFFNLLDYCNRQNIGYTIIRRYSPVVYFVRNMCLGGNVLRGENQKPFDGKINYTHLMWIDNDIAFKPAQFQSLLNSNMDIIAGAYKMADGRHYAIVENWDEEYFQKNASFKFLTDEDIRGRKGFIDVDYTGLGFMLVKKGVFESLKYPWFRPKFYKFGDCFDFCSEDVGFCRDIKEKGYKIYIDPRIIVGHIKDIVI